MNDLDLYDCELADEIYKTERVQGAASLTKKERKFRYDHAVRCGQKKWMHALPTHLWDLADAERMRRKHADNDNQG